MLKTAVAGLQGKKTSNRLEIALDLDFVAFNEADYAARPKKLPAFLVAGYMQEAPLRIAAYKQLAEVTSQKQLTELVKNWRDRFGPYPAEVENLIRTVELNLAASKKGYSSLQVKEDKLMLTKNGDYFQINGKFPRLRPSAKPKQRLEESLAWMEKL